ncbi:hypothetical protein PR202_ga09399 [Eleusine coracana subsp. coracana]|uniref:F-box domain-containing protein n=1 Tax=Eleusine coracana subsp. coracana TaxID=191504 RepID=A0AAV5C2P5_ELECO|nr:hypothetical protein PR202_ga09399 [Eleusine coracana subsp. coracana]
MESDDEQARETSESAIDWISSLPTEILHNILSFVQMRSVVRMRSLYIIFRFLQLSPRLQKVILTHTKLPKAGKGAVKDSMPNSEMTFHCPHLQTVIIHCSKDDSEIYTVVNAMVDNGVALEKIQVTFYEDIIKRCVSEVRSNLQKQKKELRIFEKMLKENPEWADDSSYTGSESDNRDDDDDDDEDNDEDSWDEDDDDGDDASLNESNDMSGDDDGDESGNDDNEIVDEDDDSKMEVEHDDKMEVEHDENDMEEVGLDNNEHGDYDL